MRPIASGSVSKRAAISIMSLLIIIGFSLMMHLSLNASSFMLIYLLINVLYSFYLKHFAIVDVSVIATGFVLRIFVGSYVGDVSLSIWIIIMTFLLALFLGLAKRRDDLMILRDTGVKLRKVIDGYTLEFIDHAMAVLAAVVIVSYILYTSSAEVIARVGSQYFPLTAIFVILGVMRYMQITFVFKNSGSPTHVILTDRFLQFTLILWMISCGWILYS
jgi:4-hydroxybenzoate polyprenyltransferase